MQDLFILTSQLGVSSEGSISVSRSASVGQPLWSPNDFSGFLQKHQISSCGSDFWDSELSRENETGCVQSAVKLMKYTN